MPICDIVLALLSHELQGAHWVVGEQPVILAENKGAGH
jgi:hypothetical protein